MDLSTVIDWSIQGFKKLSGSTILSVISIFIAITVFRFNKKMGYSKLSVSPLCNPYDLSSDLSSIDFTYLLQKLSWIQSVKGLPTGLLNRIDRDLDRNVPFDTRFNAQMLTVKLRNKGELASANIRITLIFKAYGTKLSYPKNRIDEANFKSAKRKLFSKKKIVIKVPYMGADDEKEFLIAELKGQFRETELILCKIRANGHTYFKERFIGKFFNRVIIHHYTHPYLGGAADSSDLNMLYGVHEPEEKWKDPYKRIGGVQWLQNLYVEWRK